MILKQSIDLPAFILKFWCNIYQRWDRSSLPMGICCPFGLNIMIMLRVSGITLSVGISLGSFNFSPSATHFVLTTHCPSLGHIVIIAMGSVIMVINKRRRLNKIGQHKMLTNKAIPFLWICFFSQSCKSYLEVQKWYEQAAAAASAVNDNRTSMKMR